MSEYRFATREQASIAVAERILAALKRQLDANDAASMVVSGGTTPAHCLSRLAMENIDWSKVTVFLSDERWVPRDHADSNEKMINDNLCSARAKAAALQPVYREDASVEQRCREIDADLRGLANPLASVLLGMGVDGHFASLFPDFDELAASLEADGEQFCVPVRSEASAHSRLSLTLSALCHSEEILLLIFGEDKWQTLERARRAEGALPVSNLLLQTRTPVRVFWAA